MEWGQKMSSVTFFKFVFFPVYISFLHGYFILQNLSVQELVKPMTLAALLLCIVACVILTAHRTSFTFCRSLPGFSVLFQSKSSHLSVFSLQWWKRSVEVCCDNCRELKLRGTGIKHLKRQKDIFILIKVMSILFFLGINAVCLANENSTSQIKDHLSSCECKNETKCRDCESNANE